MLLLKIFDVQNIQDQQPIELPQGKKVLIFVFNLVDVSQGGLEVPTLLFFVVVNA